MNKLVDAFMETLDPVDEQELFKPLDPELEYVDATHYELEMAHRVRLLGERLTAVEESQRRMAVNMLAMLEHIKALAESQSTSQPQSAIILPDRFN